MKNSTSFRLYFVLITDYIYFVLKSYLCFTQRLFQMHIYLFFKYEFYDDKIVNLVLRDVLEGKLINAIFTMFTLIINKIEIIRNIVI